MSYIKATIGGKAKGLADQVTIDPALGCKYRCVGCYAKKSSQRGTNYDSVICKELDKEILKKSIRYVKTKGFQLGRVGKHCDPGDHLDSLNSILDCCNDESFRCVVVSKGLTFNSLAASLLKAGKHLLQMSLGPYSPICRPEKDRVETAIEYKKSGVNTFIRLTRDITREMAPIDKYAAERFDCIVTPLRFPSSTAMRFYDSNIESFEFISGYYRPKLVHPTWSKYMKYVCGEINGSIKCCNCMIR
jgi:DNA repair photolyase